MKRYFTVVVSALLVLLLIFNIFIVRKNNADNSQRTSNTITEILRCIDDTKACLQNLIDNQEPSEQSKMMYVINGEFSTLYHLCHANRDIYGDACSDFEHIGATFIGPAGTRFFTTNGIYDDSQITENEYAYVRELIALLDAVRQNISGDDAKEDLRVLNSNLEDMHEQLYHEENSPYRLIRATTEKS